MAYFYLMRLPTPLEQSEGINVVSITVERLTGFVLCRYLLPHLIFLKLSQQSPLTVAVIDAHPTTYRLTAFILKCMGVGLHTHSFRLVDLHDQRGNLLRLTISYVELKKIQECISQDVFFKQVNSSTTGLFKDYLYKSSIAFVWNRGENLWRLILITQLAWILSQQRHQQHKARVVLFAFYRPWVKPLSSYLAQFPVEIHFVKSCDIDVADIIKRSLGHVRIKFLLTLLLKPKEIYCNLLQQSSFSHSLILEYYGLCSLSDPNHYSDFTFLQQSNFNSRDIVVVTNLTSAPLTQEQYDALHAKGIKAIGLHPKAVSSPHIPVYTTWYWSLLNKIRKVSAPYSYRREKQWFKALGELYQEQYEYYARLFKLTKAKLYVTWFKYDAQHIPISAAIKDAGGIMVFYQRAMEPDASAETATYCDVFFGFSATMANVELASGSKIPYFVVTGYLGDHRFKSLQKPADELRLKLQSHGASFILAFFDENSGADSRWHTGHEFMRENYRFILEKVLANSHLGLVLKPKAPKTLRARLGPVAQLLEQALKTGRCYMYEDQGIQSSFPPAIAALSSDVAIHGHMCAATAGLEAALAGIPTVLLDREGWPDSSMYRLGEGTVVFKSWDVLWQAIESHQQQPNPSLGDWSKHIHEFDPFRDGQASLRMGEYLSWLNEGLKRGIDREQVLIEAAKRYQDKWGQDKVISIGV